MHCLESGAAGLPAAPLSRLGLLPWTLATWEQRDRKLRAMKNKKHGRDGADTNRGADGLREGGSHPGAWDATCWRPESPHVEPWC